MKMFQCQYYLRQVKTVCAINIFINPNYMWLHVIQVKLNLKQYWPAILFVAANVLLGIAREAKGLGDFRGIKLKSFITQLSVFCIQLPCADFFSIPPLIYFLFISTDLVGQCDGANGGCHSLVAMDTLCLPVKGLATPSSKTLLPKLLYC